MNGWFKKNHGKQIAAVTLAMSMMMSGVAFADAPQTEQGSLQESHQRIHDESLEGTAVRDFLSRHGIIKVDDAGKVKPVTNIVASGTTGVPYNKVIACWEELTNEWNAQSKLNVENYLARLEYPEGVEKRTLVEMYDEAKAYRTSARNLIKEIFSNVEKVEVGEHGANRAQAESFFSAYDELQERKGALGGTVSAIVNLEWFKSQEFMSRNLEEEWKATQQVVAYQRDTFIKDYLNPFMNGEIDIPSKDIIATPAQVTEKNKDMILRSEEVWNNLYSHEQEQINMLLNDCQEKYHNRYEKYDYQDILDAAKAFGENTAINFVKNYLSSKSGQYEDITIDNAAQIIRGKDAWEKLSTAEKKKLDDMIKTGMANGEYAYTLWEHVYADAVVYNDAKQFLDALPTDLTFYNYEAFIALKADFDDLKTEVKTGKSGQDIVNSYFEVDAALVTDVKVSTYDEAYKQATECETAMGFLDGYMKQNNAIVENTTSATVDTVEKAYDKYYSGKNGTEFYADGVNDKIDRWLVRNRAKNFADYISYKDVKNGNIILHQFLKCITDNAGNLYNIDTMTSDQAKDVVTGKEAWNTWEDDAVLQRGYVSEWIQNAYKEKYDVPYITYVNFLTRAESILGLDVSDQVVADAFIKKYMPATVTIDNAATVVAGEAEYNKLTDNQKKLVGDYASKLAEAKKILADKAAADAFVKKHPYVEVTEDNAEEIAGYRAAWDALSDAVKKYIEKDYESLIAQAENFEVRPVLTYSTHVQNLGWQDYVLEGKMSGTSGKSLRLEAIRINLEKVNGGVMYQTHVQNVGWQNWVKTNELSGTSGRCLRLEGIKIKLTGEIAEKYSIEYRTHVQNLGWKKWVRDGEMSGTSGKSLRLEGIEIRLVEK